MHITIRDRIIELAISNYKDNEKLSNIAIRTRVKEMIYKKLSSDNEAYDFLAGQINIFYCSTLECEHSFRDKTTNKHKCPGCEKPLKFFCSCCHTMRDNSKKRHATNGHSVPYSKALALLMLPDKKFLQKFPLAEQTESDLQHAEEAYKALSSNITKFLSAVNQEQPSMSAHDEPTIVAEDGMGNNIFISDLLLASEEQSPNNIETSKQLSESNKTNDFRSKNKISFEQYQFEQENSPHKRQRKTLTDSLSPPTSPVILDKILQGFAPRHRSLVPEPETNEYLKYQTMSKNLVNPKNWNKFLEDGHAAFCSCCGELTPDDIKKIYNESKHSFLPSCIGCDMNQYEIVCTCFSVYANSGANALSHPNSNWHTQHCNDASYLSHDKTTTNQTSSNGGEQPPVLPPLAEENNDDFSGNSLDILKAFMKANGTSDAETLLPAPITPSAEIINVDKNADRNPLSGETIAETLANDPNDVDGLLQWFNENIDDINESTSENNEYPSPTYF